MYNPTGLRKFHAGAHCSMYCGCNVEGVIEERMLKDMHTAFTTTPSVQYSQSMNHTARLAGAR